MSTGLIHIYCGDGKGKTSAAMGLAIRAAGNGLRILIYQFMKNNTSSERHILNNIDNITITDGLDNEKFSFQMNEQEKEERRKFYMNQFETITNKAENENYDVLIMDEIIYAMAAGLMEEEPVINYLTNKPEKLEIVLTGNKPSTKLVDIADYVSEIKKIKHPYDKGIKARKGIEK